jgi:thiol-disulfide isomerase/thioredoxin
MCSSTGLARSKLVESGTICLRLRHTPMKPSRTTSKLAVSIAGLAAGVLLLAGCSSDMDESSMDDAGSVSESVSESVGEPTEETVESDMESVEPAVVANPLPVFSSTTLDGQSVTQATYEGKPTIMWFWAPWCSVCRGEAPTISEVAGELDGSVDVVGVAALGSTEEMNTFVSDTGIGNISNLNDPDAEVWSVFGVASQPAFAFIGADGSIDVVAGSLDKEEILERAANLG